ncbi:MAG: hypothetical protein KDB20_03230 [Microthrixaceae bacterium]|nr:hypothetical protein [Microthrixaceae bacterium]
MFIAKRRTRVVGLLSTVALFAATACVESSSSSTPLTDLTITAPSFSVVYGSDIASIEPTYSPRKVTTSGLQCSTTATATSPVGTYPVVCSGATYGTTNISYVDGVITITPAPLTIQASSGNLIPTDPAPVITPLYSGLRAGDTAPATAPLCSTTATTSSPYGTYPTTCVGAADANYTITTIDGTMQVAAARLTVQASSAAMTQGDPLPLVTAAYSGWVDGDTAIDVGATCRPLVAANPPAGQFPTGCSGASDSKYAFTYVDGTIDVAAAGLISYQNAVAVTSVAPASNGVTLPSSSISVFDRSPGTGFGDFTNLTIATTSGLQIVSCTGGNPTTFTGCTGGTGTLHTGAAVTTAAPTDFALSSIIPGGKTGFHPTSVEVVSDVAQQLRLVPTSVVRRGDDSYVRYLQSSWPFGSGNMTIGYCRTESVYSPASSDCATVRVSVLAPQQVTMGARVSVAGITQNQYQVLNIGSRAATVAKPGDIVGLQVAAASSQIPNEQKAQDVTATVRNVRTFMSVIPIPAGFELIDAKIVGGDERTSTGSVVAVCTQDGPDCTARLTGNWNQTKFPYVQASIGSTVVPGGTTITLPALDLTLRATGAAGTRGTTGLSQFRNVVIVDVPVVGSTTITFDSWPSSGSNTGVTPPVAPMTPLMDTVIN